MVYNEEVRDLFTVDKDYSLVHCISGDLAMGAGIAVDFANMGVRNSLQTMYRSGAIGDALVTTCSDWKCEISLVTKDRAFEKPTLSTLRKALVALNSYVRSVGLKKLAMPKIGCGLDRLKWEDVSVLIKEVFENTDVEILVCDRPVTLQ